MKYPIKTLVWTSLFCLGCQDLLDVPNSNQPTPATVRSEQGIIALAQGGVYVNGLGGYFGNLTNFHERMGDIVGSPLVPMNLWWPDRIVLDDGSEVLTTGVGGQKGYLRSTNIPPTGNLTVQEWYTMYSMIGAMNAVQENVDLVDMPVNKKRTIHAWARFWKGFAYSRIGSLYYSGIINNVFNSTNGNYVTSTDVLAEAEQNLFVADTTVQNLADHPEFEEVMDALIPSICKFGRGLTPAMDDWRRMINTLRARNILVNTPAASMTSEKWDEILALTTNGLQVSSRTFTARTDPNSGILGTNGFCAAQAIGTAANGGGNNKLSERFVQDFKLGDLRFTNNINVMATPYIAPGDRGISLNTRYLLVDKGKGMPGVYVYVNRTVGAQELYITTTFEENMLMMAEAYIYKGNLDAGLALIDQLRSLQGSGLAPVASTGLTGDEAKEELRRERRVALAFRGLSFYDARRWGLFDNPRTGCSVVSITGAVSTNATIYYGYLDYWDVPAREVIFNPPTAGSAPIVNPN